eukprot:981502_1
MLSTLRKGCNSFSLDRISNKISNIVRCKNYIFKFSTDTDDSNKTHPPMSSSQETRMRDIIDLWDYELERNNAGAFGMQFIVSHPTTRIQNTHILKATSLFQQIMGYIAGGDGLSQAEIDLLCENQQLLCNYSFTSKVARNNLEIGALFTEE